MSLYTTFQVAIAAIVASNGKELEAQLQKKAKDAAFQTKVTNKKHKLEKKSLTKQHRKEVLKLIKSHEAEQEVRTHFNFILIHCIVYYYLQCQVNCFIRLSHYSVTWASLETA